MHFSVMGTVSQVEFNWSALGRKDEEADGKSDVLLSVCRRTLDHLHIVKDYYIAFQPENRGFT